MNSNQHKLGQYFTTSHELQKKVIEFISNKPDVILEPSVGKGDLIEAVINKYSENNIKFDMYEIDNTIKPLTCIPNNIIYSDFITQEITRKYKTIIGNPPFVKTKKGNLYIDFTEKCYNILDDNGELIFIVPSDFFKLTSSTKLLNKMMASGTFTHIYHPHKENLFKNASIDVLIYRYCKNVELEKKVIYNNELLYIINNDGLITFNKDNQDSNIDFKDYFDIYVGMVNGKESVYKNKELGNIELINGENKINKYIFINTYPCENDEINKYLQQHKDVLINRKIKKFNDENWFEWGAPRNISNIKKNMGSECIYIYNLTRAKIIAFKGRVNYFGGSLLCLIPKKDKNIKLDLFINYLNSDEFKKNFMFSGRFKIGHRQISNSYIPQSILDKISMA